MFKKGMIVVFALILSINFFALYSLAHNRYEPERAAYAEPSEQMSIMPMWGGMEVWGRWSGAPIIFFDAHSQISQRSIDDFAEGMRRWNNQIGFSMLNLNGFRHSGLWENSMTRDHRNRVYRQAIGIHNAGGIARRHWSGNFVNGLHEIVEVDILLNVSHPFANNLPGSSTYFDVFTTFMHELGHVIGLGHAPMRPNVMFESLAPGEQRRTLQVHDREGVSILNYNRQW